MIRRLLTRELSDDAVRAAMRALADQHGWACSCGHAHSYRQEMHGKYFVEPHCVCTVHTITFNGQLIVAATGAVVAGRPFRLYNVRLPQ